MVAILSGGRWVNEELYKPKITETGFDHDVKSAPSLIDISFISPNTSNLASNFAPVMQEMCELLPVIKEEKNTFSQWTSKLWFRLKDSTISLQLKNKILWITS